MRKLFVEMKIRYLLWRASRDARMLEFYRRWQRLKGFSDASKWTWVAHATKSDRPNCR